MYNTEFLAYALETKVIVDSMYASECTLLLFRLPFIFPYIMHGENCGYCG
jgi:hypothetical protein